MTVAVTSTSKASYEFIPFPAQPVPLNIFFPRAHSVDQRADEEAHISLQVLWVEQIFLPSSPERCPGCSFRTRVKLFPAPCCPHGSYGNKAVANGSKAQTSYQGPKGFFFFLGTPSLSFAPMAINISSLLLRDMLEAVLSTCANEGCDFSQPSSRLPL